MKGQIHLLALTLLVALLAVPAAWAATISKTDDANALNLGTSWVGGVAPTSSDVALFNNTITTSRSPNLGANAGWLGIQLTSPGGAITIGNTPAATLTLGSSGIDMSAASQNLTISSGLALGAGNQTWNVKSAGRTLAVSGTFSRNAGTTLMITTNASGGIGTVTFSPTMVNNVVPWLVMTNAGAGANNSAAGYTFGTVSGGNIVAFTTATAETASYPANSATANYDWSATGNLGAIGSSRSNNTIRFTGTAAVSQTVNSAQTETMNGLMNAGGGTVTLGGGANTMSIRSSGSGELVLAAMTSGIIINGPIINGATPTAVTIAGPNTVTLTGAATFTGNVNVNSGTLAANRGNNSLNPTSSALGNPQTARNISVNSGGTLQFALGDTLGAANSTVVSTLIVNSGGLVTNVPGVFNTFGPIQLNGGTITGGGGAAVGYQMYNLRGTVTVGGSSMSTMSGSGSFAGYHLAAPTTFNVADVTSGTDLLVSGSLTNRNATDGGLGSLTKTGAGTMTLSGANTYGGTTTISAGTLALSGSGSINNSSTITVSNAAIFDVSSVTGGYTLAAGQTLNGNGVVAGGVSNAPLSTLSPGASPGTLIVLGNVALSSGSTNLFELSTSAGGANDQVLVSGTLACNGSTIYIGATGGASPLDQVTDYTLFYATNGTVGSCAIIPVFVGTAPANAANYSVVTSGNTVKLHYANVPLATNSATPASVVRNQSTVLEVVVTNLVSPTTISSVTVNLSSIGGSAAQAMTPTGSGSNFTYTATVAPGTTAGSKNLLATITDSSSQIGSTTLALTVNTASDVWDGGGPDDNFTSNANWASDFAPGLTGDSLTFAGTTRLTPNMDTNYSVTSLTFSNTAGSFIIGTASNTLTNGSGGITNNSSNPQTLNMPVVFSAAQTLNAASGNLTLNSNVASGGSLLTVDGANTITLNGAFSGGGGLTKNGSGTLNLGGQTTTVGAVTISDGTIQNGTLTGTSYTATETGSATISAILAGSGIGLTHSGSGTLTLSAANTLSGTVTLSAGTLVAAHTNALNSTTRINVPANVTVSLKVATDGAGDGTIKLGLGTGTTTLNLVSDRATSGAGISHPLSVLAGNGLGGGTLNFTGGANVTSGTGSFSFDTLGLGAGSVTTTILNPTTATVSIGAVSKFNNTQAQTLQLDGTTAGNEITGTIANGTATTVTITKANTSTWTLSGANTFTGGVNINGGVLVANNATALSTSGTIALGGGTLRYGTGITTDYSPRFSTAASQAYNIDVNGNNVTYGTALTSSGGSLTLSSTAGGGSLTLSAARTYTGATTINGATLGILSSSTGNGTITVNDGGALRVTVSGANKLSSASLTLGSSTGVTNIFANVSSTSVEVINASTLTLNGANVLSIASVTPAVGTYPLIVATNLTGSGSLSLGTLPLGVNGSLSTSGSGPVTYSLVITSIDPTVWAASGNGSWDLITTNWTIASAPSLYTDGATVLFDDSAPGGNALVTITNPTVSPSAVTVNNSSKSYTIDGVIADTASLLKTNNGSLTLLGTNTYTGGTTIGQGTLQLGDGSTKNGAVAGNIINNGALIVANPNLQTNAGVISGSGTVTKSGAGMLTFTNAQTYSGPTTISAGILQLSGSGTLSAGDVTNNASILLNFSGTPTVANSISGSGIVSNTGSGTVTLSGNSSFSGGVVSTNGTMSLSHNNALGTGILLVTNAAKQVNLIATLTVTNPIVLGPGTGSGITAQGLLRGPLTSGSATVSGPITILAGSGGSGGPASGGHFDGGNAIGGLIVSGPISAASGVGVNHRISRVTFSGGGSAGLFLSSGTTVLGANDGLPLNTELDLGTSGNAIFDMAGFNQTLNGLRQVVNTATVTNSGGANSRLTISGVSSNTTFAGTISDNGVSMINLNVTGGTFTLSGANTFTGDINLTGGSLVAGLSVVGNPTAASFGNEQVAGRTITAAAGTTLNFSVNDVLGNAAANAAFLPSIVLSNATLTSVRFNQLGNLTLASGSTLTQNNTTDTGTYQQYQFLGTVTVNGTSASSLTTANFKGNHLGANTTFDVADVTGDASADVTLSAPLLDQSGNYGSGPGSLTKTGAGTMLLTGTNTYTGPTTISGGTLTLGAGSALPSTNINVGGSATFDVSAGGFTLATNKTLKGNGTVVGSVTNSGSITPGASIGTLTFGPAPVLNGGGVIVAEINRTNSPNADKLVASAGTLMFGGTLTITNIGGTPQNGDTFDLFDGTLSGSFATLNLPPGGVAHWNTSDLYIGGTITFTNSNPVASNFSLGVAVGGSVSVNAIDKYAAATDADGDAVTISAVSTPANGTAGIVGGTNITYTSTNSAASDSFTYTVSDGLGGTDTKTVTVSTYSPEGFNRLSPPSVIGPGTVVLSYLGIPGYNYALDWTTNLTPPITWTAVITNTAAGDGSLSYTNSSSEPVNFFRTRHVP